MSHTDKDRPYWVKNNDDKLRRKTKHNHELFGTPRYRRKAILDANGNEMLEEVIRERITLKANGNIMTGWQMWGRDNLYNANGELHANYRSEKYIAGHKVKFETVVDFIYPDYCTANLNGPRGHAWGTAELPCYNYVVEDNVWGPNQSDRSYISSVDRSRARAVLRNFEKTVNTVGWDDEDFDDSAAPNKHRRWGWWD